MSIWSEKRGVGVWLWAAVIVVVVLSFPYIHCNCVDGPAARATLESQGFTNVTTGDTFDWFACGRDDVWATSFDAASVTGERVSGTVCCGLLKNCTVRLER